MCQSTPTHDFLFLAVRAVSDDDTYPLVKRSHSADDDFFPMIFFLPSCLVLMDIYDVGYETLQENRYRDRIARIR